MKRCIVSGGAGEVGYHLAKYLAKQDCTVIIVDNFLRGNRDADFDALVAKKNVMLCEGNLCNQDFVASLPLDVDYVYHLAAVNGTSNFYSTPFTVLENSTIPTLLLLKHYAASKRLKRFFYASSSETYASSIIEFSWTVPTDESVVLSISNISNPRWSYATSKINGESACVAAAFEYGVPISIGRLHNVYGPRMGTKHVIPDFLSKAMRGVYQLDSCTATRAFIFVEDAVRACILVAESEICKDEIVNIGGAPEITILELANKIMSILGKKEEILCGTAPIGSVQRRAPLLDKLSSLRYEPIVSLDEGLSITVADYINRYNLCRPPLEPS